MFRHISPLFVVRLGIAVVFLWFGMDKFFRPLVWFGFVPEFAVGLNPLSPSAFMYVQGVVETALGFLLLIGFFTRIASVAAAFIMLLVVVSLGFNDLGIRDFAVFCIAVALSLSDPVKPSLDFYLRSRKLGRAVRERAD